MSSFGSTRIRSCSGSRGADERRAVARLNLLAGKAAQAGGAADAALTYFEAGVLLLGESAWQETPDLAVALHLGGAAASVLCPQREPKVDFVGRILANRTDRGEVLLARESRIRRHIIRNERLVALEESLDALKSLGVSLPASPHLGHVLWTLARVQLRLRGKSTEQLSSLPIATDDRVIAAQRLMMNASAAAYFVRPMLLPLLILRTIDLALDSGISAPVGQAFTGNLFIVLTQFADMAGAARMAEVARAVLRRVPGGEFLVRAEVTMGFYELRVLPFAALRARDASLYRLAIECGDIEFAGISLYNQMNSALLAGEDLVATAALGDTLLEASRRIGDRRTELALLVERGQIASLQGTTADASRYDPAFVNEDAMRADLEAAGSRSDLAVYYLGAVRLLVFAGDLAAAQAPAEKLAGLLDALPGSPSEAMSNLFLCVVWGEAARGLSGSARRAALAKLNRNRKSLAAYGSTGPANFGHMLKLADAMHLAATQDLGSAMAAFDAVIDLAVQGDFLHTAGLAAECAGRLQLSVGHSRAARSYLEESEAAYVQWGALAPARRVAELRGAGGLQAAAGAVSASGSTTGKTLSGMSTLHGDRLDGLAVSRAAQAISSEVRLPDLIDRLLRLALEIGGGSRAVLVLSRDGATQVAGEAVVDGGKIVVRQAGGASPFEVDDTSARVARYVAQTREPVLIRDRRQDGRWPGEAALGGPVVSSVLALPLLQGNTLTGVVVLSHEMPGAFTAARREVVATVAAQAAISIQNATLYEELRASLAAQEDLTRSYQRFVPLEFLDALGKRSILDVGPGDHIHREITVLFADVRGFTTLAERLGPSETFAFINRYTAAIAPAIRKHGGFINGFLGDGIMALFPTSADDAVAGAVAMQEAVQRFNEQRAGSGEPDVRIGIGLNTGPLVLGTIGVAERMDSGVSGDCVNLASRVEGMTKLYGAPIVIGESTYERLRAPERFSLRELDYVIAVGRKQAVHVYEVMDGEDAGLREAKQRMAPSFAAARALLVAGNIDRALVAFSAISEACPADRAARLLVQRCVELRDVGVPANWDGSYRLGQK